MMKVTLAFLATLVSLGLAKTNPDQLATPSRRGHYIIATPSPISRTSAHTGGQTTEAQVAETSERSVRDDLATTDWRPMAGPNAHVPDTLARRALMDYVNQNYITRSTDGRLLLPADQANVAAALIRASYLFSDDNFGGGENPQVYPTTATYTTATAVPKQEAYTAGPGYYSNEISQQNHAYPAYSGSYAPVNYANPVADYGAAGYSTGTVGSDYSNEDNSYTSNSGNDGEGANAHEAAENNGYSGNSASGYGATSSPVTGYDSSANSYGGTGDTVSSYGTTGQLVNNYRVVANSVSNYGVTASPVATYTGQAVPNYSGIGAYGGYSVQDYANYVTGNDQSDYSKEAYSHSKYNGYGVKSIPGHYYANGARTQQGKALAYTTTYSGNAVNTARPQLITTPAPTTTQPLSYKGEQVTLGRGFESSSESSAEADQASNYKSTEINNAVYQAYDRHRPYVNKRKRANTSLDTELATVERAWNTGKLNLVKELSQEATTMFSFLTAECNTSIIGVTLQDIMRQYLTIDTNSPSTSDSFSSLLGLGYFCGHVS